MESPKLEIRLPLGVSVADRNAVDWLYGVVSGVQRRYSIYLRMPISGEIGWSGPGKISVRLRIRIERDDLARAITRELVESVADAEERLGVGILIAAAVRTGPL